MWSKYAFAIVVKKSARARECREERCSPKRESSFHICNRSLGIQRADARIPQPSTIVSPTVVLPTTTHGWVNQVGTISANEGSSITVPLADGLGDVPVTNDPAAFYPPSTLGSYEYVGYIDQPSLLDFGSVPYPFDPIASSSAIESISHGSTSFLEQVIPVQEKASCGENRDVLMPDISRNTVNSELAGPSTALRSQSDASSHESRGETLGNAAGWSEADVSHLRSLAWSMGYCLIPRGAANPGGGALV
ncbi:uncharacterized protein EI90DRAFT_3012831 [Cantharellus anzutake]|uniref:uncharacterized protein n=1 Tax=Cantharellus anzutake TaxID=1750568 RepID=UPI001907FB61|nr:uncharacterized protein EI90DRAFT_3012831 [Cantharellus anzutake]KAF8339925.1 hypothetical protein EI90DRAFT_3012831 [Cantharellus anzutake]